METGLRIIFSAGSVLVGLALAVSILMFLYGIFSFIYYSARLESGAATRQLSQSNRHAFVRYVVGFGNPFKDPDLSGEHGKTYREKALRSLRIVYILGPILGLVVVLGSSLV